WCVPLGMQHKKKLSDLYVDAGIPAHAKHRYPVLAAATGEIVWVCGVRIDDRFKITDTTRHVLRLQFTREIESTHEE
ncbi:MAG: tRNA lysidine(34) synthetase TilS, partial [Bacteroidetes bacterium]|nr:tRNA lysidine(34) synthetase TilS [Bacteroidota bacterium]